MAFSKLEKALLAYVGISSNITRNAAKRALFGLGRAAPTVAAANPYATGALLGGAALATPTGQDFLESAADRGRMDRIRFEQALTDLTRVTIPKAKKRTKSKFNKMVSAGMKTVKASTSYGKKGTISNAKKAFSAVTKAASAVTSGKKLPKSGIKRRLMSIMRRI
jgi:hypothetical protein